MGNVLSLFTDALGGVAGRPSFSLGCWVKTSQTSLTALMGRAYFGPKECRYMLLGGDPGASDLEELFDAGGATNSSHASSTNWNDGSWHHVLMTSDTLTWQLYLDGVNVAGSSSVTTINTETTTKFLLGAADSGSGITGFYNGKLAQPFVIWSKLNSTQAAQIAAGTLDPSSLTPRSVWNLTEGSGTTCADTGVEGNTGTLTNGVTWSSDIPSQLNPSGAAIIPPSLFKLQAVKRASSY